MTPVQVADHKGTRRYVCECGHDAEEHATLCVLQCLHVDRFGRRCECEEYVRDFRAADPMQLEMPDHAGRDRR